VRTPSVVDLWLPSTYFYVAFLTRIGFTFRLFRKIAEIDSQLRRVLPSVRNNCSPTGRISMKFDI